MWVVVLSDISSIMVTRICSLFSDAFVSCNGSTWVAYNDILSVIFTYICSLSLSIALYCDATASSVSHTESNLSMWVSHNEFVCRRLTNFQLTLRCTVLHQAKWILVGYFYSNDIPFRHCLTNL